MIKDIIENIKTYGPLEWKIDLPLVAQVYPADYDRIILAEYIRILEAICAPHVRLGNAGYPVDQS
jgi:hypothetical protein